METSDDEILHQESQDALVSSGGMVSVEKDALCYYSRERLKQPSNWLGNIAVQSIDSNDDSSCEFDFVAIPEKRFVTKRRKLESPPSLGVIQTTEPPTNPVNADIEYDGFSPGTDSGSDGDEDSVSPTCEWNVEDAPELEELTEPALRLNAEQLGAAADADLRTLAAQHHPDLLTFSWTEDVDNFRGVRATFTGPCGPTFNPETLTPLQLLQKIWDADILDLIVKETNRYGRALASRTNNPNARMSKWKDTSVEEMWKFFTILMLQSFVVNNMECEYWIPRHDQLRIGEFSKILPFYRFLSIKRCLHFVDTSVSGSASKLAKVMPVVDHLNKKFSALYQPERNVAILQWKTRRLSFQQTIATKTVMVDIKSFELCESRTGYLWKMELHSGKRQHQSPENVLESATSQIVLRLLQPLLGKGHTVVMDHFYNSPLMSRLLKAKYNTDSMGTLRLNSEFFPDTLKWKRQSKMQPGDVCCSTTEDLSVVVWRDANVVSLISTYHHRPKVGRKENYGYHKYKPKVVHHYNLCMGGIDRRDQMLQSFPMERTQSESWHKKLFRRLLNVSIHNAMVIYNHGHTRLENRNFRLQLVRECLQTYCPLELPASWPDGQMHLRQCRQTLAEMHLPAKNEKRKQCKWCNTNKKQPRQQTRWRCTTCSVNLCMDCFIPYHAKYAC